MTSLKNEWFKNWFDSPFYHILYKNRNEFEAEFFMKNLVSHLQIKPWQKILDMPCGKGRHAIFLNKLGYEVMGVDLSQNSIKVASANQRDSLKFFVHDMRQPFYINYFHFVFNLFTSLGYFEREEENQNVIRNMAYALTPGGKLVIDYFNADKIRNTQPSNEIMHIDGIDFHINRSVVKRKAIKRISFFTEGNQYEFIEMVSLFTSIDFEIFFRKAGLRLIEKFGSYDLKEFSPEESDRLIIIAQKNQS